MEAKIFEIPCSPTAQSPENLFNNMPYSFFSDENLPQNPLITDLPTSNQGLESAFSRLTLSPNSLFHSQATSFLGRTAAVDAAASTESISLPITFAQSHPSSIWAQAQSSIASASTHFGLPWAHHRINVGPDSMGFSGRGPSVCAGDRDRLMKIQRHDFLGAGSENCGFSILHGKKPFSSNNFLDLPLARPSNFGSSASSLYSNHQWQQELTPEILSGRRILYLANDQMWSGVLNSKLEEGLSEAEIDLILPEAMEFSGDLMRRQFGGNFVTKLFAACNEEQRTEFIMSLTRCPLEFIDLCLNSYGARAVQEVLKKLMTPQQISLLVSALTPAASVLSRDPNGQHLIDFCVKNFSEEYVKHLLNEIAQNCYQIATNKSGCCVLQSCVEHSHGESRQRLITKIIANAVHLSEDPYGNYVVQHLIGLKIPRVTADLVRRFKGHFVSLSTNKFASNVVEKFLKESGDVHSSMIMVEMLESPNVSILLLDPYGNFVIQSALSVSRGPVHDALLNLIRANAPSMQSNLYGKKILAWFEKRLKMV